MPQLKYPVLCKEPYKHIRELTTHGEIKHVTMKDWALEIYHFPRYCLFNETLAWLDFPKHLLFS